MRVGQRSAGEPRLGKVTVTTWEVGGGGGAVKTRGPSGNRLSNLTKYNLATPRTDFSKHSSRAAKANSTTKAAFSQAQTPTTLYETCSAHAWNPSAKHFAGIAASRYVSYASVQSVARQLTLCRRQAIARTGCAAWRARSCLRHTRSGTPVLPCRSRGTALRTPCFF